MQRRCFSVLAVAVGLLWTCGSTGAQEYSRPLRVRGFTAQATTLPAQSIGTTVIRKTPAIAVEFLVQVVDFLPRGLEPQLFIDGNPVVAPTRVVKVEDNITTIGFLVEKPNVLKEGAALDIQMGDDIRTRSRIPGQLQRGEIRLIPEEQLRRLGLPSLRQWLETSP